MTDLRNGQMTDLLQNDLKHNPDVQAISFAIQKEKQRILALEAKTRLSSAIEELDEPVLDVLSVELQTPGYFLAKDINQKRAVIKRALLYHRKSGTVAGLELALRATHEKSTVEEWFDYNGAPGHFKVNVDISSGGSASQHEAITQSILLTKNARSWLDGISYMADCTPASLRAGAYACSMAHVNIWPEPDQQTTE